jgi:hypothetical protein
MSADYMLQLNALLEKVKQASAWLEHAPQPLDRAVAYHYKGQLERDLGQIKVALASYREARHLYTIGAKEAGGGCLLGRSVTPGCNFLTEMGILLFSANQNLESEKLFLEGLATPRLSPAMRLRCFATTNKKPGAGA